MRFSCWSISEGRCVEMCGCRIVADLAESEFEELLEQRSQVSTVRNAEETFTRKEGITTSSVARCSQMKKIAVHFDARILCD